MLTDEEKARLIHKAVTGEGMTELEAQRRLEVLNLLEDASAIHLRACCLSAEERAAAELLARRCWQEATAIEGGAAWAQIFPDPVHLQAQAFLQGGAK